jgi:hypothetical protein
VLHVEHVVAQFSHIVAAMANYVLRGEVFERVLDSDTGEAVKQHLAAGRPIYYADPAYPEQVVKQFPDGRRQLVHFERPTGVETFLKDL